MKLKYLSQIIGLFILCSVLFIQSCKKEKDNTVKDADGNVYHTVVISTQTWMVENLRTAHFRDGSAIPEVENNTDWNNISATPAWCYYNGDASNNAKYGKMYNAYAVNDPRGICPAGWHVASNEEWTVLLNYLGGESVAGGKLKATTLWNSPNTGADNSSGFTAYPGGFRWLNGDFNSLGDDIYFWTSSATSNQTQLDNGLFNNLASVNRIEDNNALGDYVRCIKD